VGYVARTRSGRGIGFFLIVAVVIYGLLSAGIALSTARECGDKGQDREWNIVPPHWECKGYNGPFVPVN
jgi:hypothetical protein